MARAYLRPDTSALVVGLCPDAAVYGRLATSAEQRGLTSDALRAGCTQKAIAAADAVIDTAHAPWRKCMVRIDQLDESALLNDAEGDPILGAGLLCLSKMPGGGAPWQGSWRSNGFGDVLKSLQMGGIILVIEAQTIDEQREWARTLLKCGCAFVQTHGGGGLAHN